MYKYFKGLFLYLIMFFAVMIVTIFWSKNTYFLENHAHIQGDMLDLGCPLYGWEYADQEWRFYFTTEGEEELSLIIADVIKPFRVEWNGEEIFQYEESDGYQRLRHIELPRTEGGKKNEIVIKELQYWSSYKFLLGQTGEMEKNYNLSNGFEMMALGIYVGILIHSLALYWKKRSEKYLLLLAGLASLALLSYASSYNLLPIPVVLSQPIRYLRNALSVLLCFRLCQWSLPKKWAWILSYKGVFIYTGIMLLLYFFDLPYLYDFFAYVLVIPSSVAVIHGYRTRCIGCAPLLVGTAIREALRIYNYGYNYGLWTTSPFAIFFYLPQLWNVIFAIACMLSIDWIFAEKFRQADDLTVVLEEKVVARTKELQQANEDIKDAQRKKDQMTTGIYHDLRNPIFIAQGSAEMLEVSGERNQRNLDTIRNRLTHLNHLTEELFLLAKLEDNAVTFDSFWINLHELCASVAQGFAMEAERKGIRQILDIPSDLQIVGDSYHIKKVIENLYTNAIHFTENGSIQLSGWREGNRVTIHLADTGCGIEPEVLPHIFDRYYHKDKSSSGLGLYIVYQIVHAHGGQIEVESEIGKGTSFWLYFEIPDETKE